MWSLKTRSIDRQSFARPLLLGFWLAFTLSAPIGAAKVTAVEAIAIPVSNLERSVEFFTKVLDFQKVNEAQVTTPDYARLHALRQAKPRLAWLRLGDELLVLADYGPKTGRAVPADSKSHDRWFQHIAIIVSDMDKAYARLEAHRVAHASPSPQTLPAWNKNAGGIKAYYFKDPDNHPLEILWFPEGKGDPKWQRSGPNAPLFLGIDHTAIVVSSTDRSLRFWRDELGLEVKGESENYGPEQEKLNDVPGAHLRITGLRAARGPGIEFLEYLAPSGGRPYPKDSRANDLWQWETILRTASVDLADHDLWRSSVPFVSKAPVPLNHVQGQGGKGLVVRDPDGHAVELVEASTYAQN